MLLLIDELIDERLTCLQEDASLLDALSDGLDEGDEGEEGEAFEGDEDEEPFGEHPVWIFASSVHISQLGQHHCSCNQLRDSRSRQQQCGCPYTCAQLSHATPASTHPAYVADR
jgi:hypothetical protein